MHRKTQLQIMLPVGLLLIGICAAFAIIALRPKIAIETPKSEVPRVTIIQVEPKTVTLNVKSQGVVSPLHEIDLIPEVAGKVTQLHPDFVAGGFFNYNDLLVAIDTRDYDYEIALSQAQVAEAKRLLATEEAQADQARSEWKALGNGQASPLAMREPQMAEARAKLAAAKAGLIHAQIKRSRCELRAPFSGRLQSKNIGLGQFIQPGDKLARIYSTDVVEIRLPLTTDQLSFLDLPLDASIKSSSNNPKVNITAQFASAHQSWQGRIVRTEGAIDETTGILYAVAQVNKPYQNKNNHTPLLSGLFIQAEIKGKAMPNLYELPQAAINAAQEVMLVDRNQKLHIQRLGVLRNESDRIVVNKGLKAGDRIVISGIEIPIEGITVKVDN